MKELFKQLKNSVHRAGVSQSSLFSFFNAFRFEDDFRAKNGSFQFQEDLKGV